MIWQIALRNVFRHRTRSLITLSAIAFGCVSLIFVGGFFDDIFFKMRESYIKAHTGHLQVYRQGFLEEGRRNPHAYLIVQPQEVAALIRTLPGVRAVTPRLEFAGLLSTGDTTISCLGQGVEPSQEHTVPLGGGRPRHGPTGDVLGGSVIEAGEPLDDTAPFGIVLGRGLAEAIGAAAGDNLIVVAHTVGGAINALDISVRGIFFTSAKAFDDHFLRLPLATAQRLLRTDAVQTLVVYLDRTEDTDARKADLERLFTEHGLPLETRTWEELSDFYVKTKQFFGQMFEVLKLVIAIIVILSIYNTMNMAVIERTAEIGTIMALGLKARDVRRLFLCEGALLGAVGGALGVVSGILVTSAISRVGIPMPPPPGTTIAWLSEPQIVPMTLGFVFMLSVITGVVSAWYPAYRASKMEIGQALRHT